MFETWIEIFLGKIGQYIIGFIVNYYYFIIPPVIAYGIFMTLASYNFKRIEKRANEAIIKQAKKAMTGNEKISYVELVSHIDIPWEKLIRQSSFFPYISQESSLWVSRTTFENVRDTIMQDDAKIRLILERNGLFLLTPEPDVKINLYTEFIHRITRKK
jgi:hypothetical protein